MAIEPTELAWLAGLIEGEGTFSASCTNEAQQYYRFRIAVQMTDRDVVERAHAIAGVGAIYGPYCRADKRQAQWRWSVDRRHDVKQLAPLLLPLMGARRQEQIRHMLAVEKVAPGRPSARHGSRHTYKTGCRCDLCRAEHARVARVWRARRREARLQEAA